MSYGPDFDENFARVAALVDRILKGTKPADLPFEQPTRFKLAINVKTAKALGLEFPTALPATAARAGLVGDDLGNRLGLPRPGLEGDGVLAGPQRKMLEPKAEPLPPPPPVAPVLGAIVALDVSGPREASRCCPAARRSRCPGGRRRHCWTPPWPKSPSPLPPDVGRRLP